MQDIMIRIETDDFEAWKTQHYLHVQNRLSYGITDGPAYQDMDNPNAALFHIKTDDMDLAMEWFRSDTFKEASRLAKVTGRTFYLAQPQTREPVATPRTRTRVIVMTGSCRQSRPKCERRSPAPKHGARRRPDRA